MTKIDLITGFLGAGKTEFIKKYAHFLMEQGEHICILENDFGAVNVDMVLLHDLLGKKCDLEMIIGGDGSQAHKRRFRTKLIAMGMKGYDRVLMEPSGIFDMDEFFDALYEEPLDQWYQAENIITIVDAGLADHISEASEYLLASETAYAGKVIFSKCQNVTPDKAAGTLAQVNSALEKYHCQRKFELEDILTRDWNDLTTEDFVKLQSCGYVHADIGRMPVDFEKAYGSHFFFGLRLSAAELMAGCAGIFKDPACGNVIRIKGFVQEGDAYREINATREGTETKSISVGQEVLIVIGESLNKDRIAGYLTNERNGSAK